jgi:hypothetical protein
MLIKLCELNINALAKTEIIFDNTTQYMNVLEYTDKNDIRTRVKVESDENINVPKYVSSISIFCDIPNVTHYFS